MVNSDYNQNRCDSVTVRFVWLWRLVQLTYLLFFIIHHIIFGISMQMKYKLTNKTRKVEIGDNYVSIIKVNLVINNRGCGRRECVNIEIYKIHV